MASENSSQRRRWARFFGNGSSAAENGSEKPRPSTWSMGILNDKKTIEVPGSVLLLAKHHNEPLGLRNAPARTSHSSLPVGYIQDAPPPVADDKKKTSDGKIILEPQPEDSANDPLNWPTWRRDSSLLSLGLYCMIGGGLTPLLAAGFEDVAHEYDVEVERISLTTGLYMMGMGLGSVVFSPTAILWGKRPVYLFSAVILCLCSVWCALSPNFVSLILARIFQGMAVSPVECLPSATIAEIFFLHERAFRIGIYTLLLLGGKNIVPLVSAAIMQSLGWRWAFWMVAIIIAFCGTLLFFFVPETFWDRAPVRRARKHHGRPSFLRRLSSKHPVSRGSVPATSAATPRRSFERSDLASPASPNAVHPSAREVHVGFAPDIDGPAKTHPQPDQPHVDDTAIVQPPTSSTLPQQTLFTTADVAPHPADRDEETAGIPSPPSADVQPNELRQKLEDLDPDASDPRASSATPTQSVSVAASSSFPGASSTTQRSGSATPRDHYAAAAYAQNRVLDSESQSVSTSSMTPGGMHYTHNLRELPALSFTQQLKPFHGRLNKDKWLKVMVRPFILYSYPAVLWSSVVYACSVGWLIVISESVSVIYRDKKSYNFNALQVGLIYISPFIGGILGTAVAGKISDIVVKYMAARNGGLYEPEFRLVMAAPIAVTTVIGLMGFGWSAEVKDAWIVPTVFFGTVSFGCSLGSTTAITFCVDSYRQYAGEALVTLNFTKNIFHGLVFSLFVTGWITSDGPKAVYIWIGVIQLIVLFSTIPMYIYGKRARMWTVRKNFMEKF